MLPTILRCVDSTLRFTGLPAAWRRTPAAVPFDSLPSFYLIPRATVALPPPLPAHTCLATPPAFRSTCLHYLLIVLTQRSWKGNLYLDCYSHVTIYFTYLCCLPFYLVPLVPIDYSPLSFCWKNLLPVPICSPTTCLFCSHSCCYALLPQCPYYILIPTPTTCIYLFTYLVPDYTVLLLYIVPYRYLPFLSCSLGEESDYSPGREVPDTPTCCSTYRCHTVYHLRSVTTTCHLPAPR